MGLVLTSILCRKSKHDSQFSISVKRMWDLLKCLKTPYSFIPEEFETYALFIMEGSINARNNSCWPTLSIRLSTRLWYSKSCSDLPSCYNLMRIPPDASRDISTQTHDDFDFWSKDFDMWMISGNSVLLFFDWCRLGRNNVLRSGMLGSLENPQSSGRFSYTQRLFFCYAQRGQLGKQGQEGHYYNSTAKAEPLKLRHRLFRLLRKFCTTRPFVLMV